MKRGKGNKTIWKRKAKGESRDMGSQRISWGGAWNEEGYKETGNEMGMKRKRKKPDPREAHRLIVRALPRTREGSAGKRYEPLLATTSQ